MRVSLVAIILTLTPMYSKADQAICTIDIDNLNTGGKQTVEYSFKISNNRHKHRKDFVITGSDYRCALVFFGLDSGTSLGCQFDDLGQHYVQSDRSVIKEHDPANKLTFRVGKSHYNLKVICQ